MSPNLIQLADTLRELGDLSPALDRARCLNVRHQRAGQCVACQEADANRCLGCNACAAACPTSALQGRSSPLDIWRRAVAAARGGAVSLVCRALRAGQTEAVPISCVSALPAESFIALRLAGVTRLTLFTADCYACPLNASLEQAKQTIRAMQTFLAKLGLQLDLEQEIGSPPATEVKPSGVSRRQFLRGFMPNPDGPSLPREDRLDDLLAAGYGWRRALLLEGLRRLPEFPALSLPAQSGYWAGLNVNSDCIGCGMCAQFCPADALSLVEGDDGQVTLQFDTSRCTACGLCQRTCFKHAIADDAPIDLRALLSSEPVTLWQGVPPSNALNRHVTHIPTHV
jgi:energy-converting hydrogenase A subunit P